MSSLMPGHIRIRSRRERPRPPNSFRPFAFVSPNYFNDLDLKYFGGEEGQINSSSSDLEDDPESC